MKIAIASSGKSENSEISVAGRAPYYLIYEKTKLMKIIKNPFAVGGGGAGFGVAKMLIDEGVEMVISEKFGENMINALKEKNIKRREISNLIIKEILGKI